MASLKQFKKKHELRIEFYESLLDFMKDGFETGQAIKIIGDSYTDENGHNDSIEYQLYQAISENAVTGLSFNKIFAQYLPAQEAFLVSSAQEDATYSAIESALHKAKNTLRLKKALKSNLVEIVVGLGGSAILFTIFGKEILPNLEKLMPVEKWPALSQWFYQVASSFEVWGAILVSYFVVAIVFALKSMPKDNWQRRLAYALPVSSSVAKGYDQITMADIFNASASLIRSKIDTNDVIEIIRENDSRPFIHSNFDEIEEKLGGGTSLPEALAQSRIVHNELKPIVRRYTAIETALGPKLALLSEKSAEYALSNIEGSMGKLSTLSMSLLLVTMIMSSVSMMMITVK
jgi:type II secretory pathway component PulF